MIIAVILAFGFLSPAASLELALGSMGVVAPSVIVSTVMQPALAADQLANAAVRHD